MTGDIDCWVRGVDGEGNPTCRFAEGHAGPHSDETAADTPRAAWTRGYNAGSADMAAAIEVAIFQGRDHFVSNLRSALADGDAVDVADDDPLHAIISPADHERAVRQARAEGAAEVLADCARDAANHYVGTGESPTGYAIWRWCTEYAAALRLAPDLPTSAEETM